MTPAELKTARRRLRLTQEGLADALGVTSRAVKHWESGTRTIDKRTALAIEALINKGTTMQVYAGVFFINDDELDAEYYSVDPSNMKPPAGDEWHEVYEVEIELKPGMEPYDAGNRVIYQRGRAGSADYYDGPLFEGPTPTHPKIRRLG